MHRLVLLAVTALTVPACLDSATSYEVTIQWTTNGAPADNVSARITYDGEEIVTHGSLESRGYAGSTLITGETDHASFEVCVELGNYELVTTESGYGCESGDYECDTTTTREFIAAHRACTTIRPDEASVQLTI